MAYIWLGICIVVFVGVWRLYRDLAVPPIISAAIWIFVYILMIGSSSRYLESKHIGCFAIALLFFCCGFFASVPRRIVPVDAESYSVRINPLVAKPVLVLE